MTGLRGEARGNPPLGTAPLEGGGGSLEICCSCVAEGTALEMTLRPDPTTAVPAPPPPPPPRPLVWVAAAAAVVVVAGAAAVVVEVETGRRSGRSSSMSWLCVRTCVGRPPPPSGVWAWTGRVTGVVVRVVVEVMECLKALVYIYFVLICCYYFFYLCSVEDSNP